MRLLSGGLRILLQKGVRRMVYGSLPGRYIDKTGNEPKNERCLGMELPRKLRENLELKVVEGPLNFTRYHSCWFSDI